MDNAITLEALRSGDVALEDARTALEAALQAGDSDQRVYVALRDWTWKTLTGHLSCDDMEGWHALIRGVAARIASRSAALSERLRVLSEMIYTSIRFTDANALEDVVRREHVGAILGALRATPDGVLSREDLRRRFGLGQANLSRVLTIMASSGLVRKEMQGRRVFVRLPGSDTHRQPLTHAVAAPYDATTYVYPFKELGGMSVGVCRALPQCTGLWDQAWHIRYRYAEVFDARRLRTSGS
ncbi:winged helix-turn-helix domain-containing protein [Methylobacterium sp. D53M]